MPLQTYRNPAEPDSWFSTSTARPFSKRHTGLHIHTQWCRISAGRRWFLSPRFLELGRQTEMCADGCQTLLTSSETSEQRLPFRPCGRYCHFMCSSCLEGGAEAQGRGRGLGGVQRDEVRSGPTPAGNTRRCVCGPFPTFHWWCGGCHQTGSCSSSSHPPQTHNRKLLFIVPPPTARPPFLVSSPQPEPVLWTKAVTSTSLSLQLPL